jgi:hypothetical protein
MANQVLSDLEIRNSITILSDSAEALVLKSADGATTHLAISPTTGISAAGVTAADPAVGIKVGVSSGKIGFYGTTPQIKQPVADLSQLIDVLSAMGLIADGR